MGVVVAVVWLTQQSPLSSSHRSLSSIPSLSPSNPFRHVVVASSAPHSPLPRLCPSSSRSLPRSHSTRSLHLSTASRIISTMKTTSATTLLTVAAVATALSSYTTPAEAARNNHHNAIRRAHSLPRRGETYSGKATFYNTETCVYAPAGRRRHREDLAPVTPATDVHAFPSL